MALVVISVGFRLHMPQAQDDIAGGMRDTELMDSDFVFSTGEGWEQDPLAFFDDFVQFREGASQNDPSPGAAILLHIRCIVAHKEGGLTSSTGPAKEQFRDKLGSNRLFLGTGLWLPDWRWDKIINGRRGPGAESQPLTISPSRSLTRL